MGLDLDYIDVAARIAGFREKYPDGSLQPADVATPYQVETIGDQTFIVVVAAAYRNADDQKPGIGMAYEPFPGKTNFTRGSELQNAETSAWGRAIVAALAGDTKRGIASAEEVRQRTPKERAVQPRDVVDAGSVRGQIARWAKTHGVPIESVSEQYLRSSSGVAIGDETSVVALTQFFAKLQASPPPAAADAEIDASVESGVPVMTTQTLDHAAASRAQADELAARLRNMPRVRYPEPVLLTARCRHGATDGCSACEATRDEAHIRQPAMSDAEFFGGAA